VAGRPQFDRLLNDARMRRIDARAGLEAGSTGRSASASFDSIQELASFGVRFIALRQNIDTDDSNPMARFLLHILAAFAEVERELTRQRVTAGVRAPKHAERMRQSESSVVTRRCGSGVG
jgi:site-specific DNA recombinase